MPERCTYYPDNLITGHASQCAEVLTKFHECTQPEKVPFTITTLDSFCEEHAITRIDLLKIDTEPTMPATFWRSAKSSCSFWVRLKLCMESERGMG